MNMVSLNAAGAIAAPSCQESFSMRERGQIAGDKHSSAKTMYICLYLTPTLYGS